MRSFLLLSCAFVLASCAVEWEYYGRTPSSLPHSLMLFIDPIGGAEAALEECGSLLMEVSDPSSDSYGAHWNLNQVNDKFLDREAIARVEAVLTREGFQFNSKGSFIEVESTVGNIERLFSAEYHSFTHEIFGSQKFHRSENYIIPSEIFEDVKSVLGLDLPPIHSNRVENSVGKGNKLSPIDLNNYYRIGNTNASSTSQGVFGSNYSPADNDKFQQIYKLPRKGAATIGKNDWKGECLNFPENCAEGNLDIQWIMAVAQASTTFFATEPRLGLYKWVSSLIVQEWPERVQTISYNYHEGEEQNRIRFSNAVCQLGLRGVSMLASSGDDGPYIYPHRANKKNRCEVTPTFPAASPYVTTVGSTQGPESGKSETAASLEKNGKFSTGGGFSLSSARPIYQMKAVSEYVKSQSANFPPSVADYNRGYPDVSIAGLDFSLVLNMTKVTGSGTSVSAPVWGGLITLCNHARKGLGKKPLGFLNPALYAAPKDCFNDITKGNNNCPRKSSDGSYGCCKKGLPAAPGWDAATGLGTPNFPKLKAYLVGLP